VRTLPLVDDSIYLMGELFSGKYIWVRFSYRFSGDRNFGRRPRYAVCRDGIVP